MLAKHTWIEEVCFSKTFYQKSEPLPFQSILVDCMLTWFSIYTYHLCTYMYFCISWKFLFPFISEIHSKYWVWIWSILKNEYWTWWIPQKCNVTSHTHFRCSLTHPLVKKQLKHLWEEIFWLDDIFLNKLQIKQGHWNTIFSTSTFQLHFCIVHCKTKILHSLSWKFFSK